MDAELWARVAPLEGCDLRSSRGRWFRVHRVDERGVRIGALLSGQTMLLTWRALEHAAPFVAAGEPLPPRLRNLAPRLTAVLRAAGVGPEP